MPATGALPSLIVSVWAVLSIAKSRQVVAGVSYVQVRVMPVAPPLYSKTIGVSVFSKHKVWSRSPEVWSSIAVGLTVSTTSPDTTQPFCAVTTSV